MTTREEIVEQLLEYPTEQLQLIIRSVLEDETAVIVGQPSCKSVAGLSTGPGTLALERLFGEATTPEGIKEWSVVVKAMQVSGYETIGSSQWMSPDAEIYAYKSVLSDEHETGMRAARCYKIDSRPGDQGWLWIEDLSGWKGSPWIQENYVRGVKDIGLFAGLGTGNKHTGNNGLARHPGAGRFNWNNMKFMADQDSIESFDKLLRETLPKSTYRASKQFGKAAEAAQTKFGRGETTLVHGDCHARNLFVRENPSEHDQTVAVDWASISLGSVGVDAGTLYGSGLTWGLDEFTMLAESEAEIFGTFAEGFSSAAGRQILDSERLEYLYYVCGYAKYFGIIAAVMKHGGSRQNFMLGRTGEPTPEKAYESMIDRGERVEHLADELLRLAR